MTPTNATEKQPSVSQLNSDRWERTVPVYGFPVVNQFFLGLSALVLIALVLTAYRELAGLGPVSGMNDAYGWGPGSRRSKEASTIFSRGSLRRPTFSPVCTSRR